MRNSFLEVGAGLVQGVRSRFLPVMLLLLLSHCGGVDRVPNQPSGNTVGSAGAGSSADASGTQGQAGVLVGAAGQSSEGAVCSHAKGTGCSGDLSSVGKGYFEIDFELTTTAAGPSAVVSQRAICTHAYFWDIRVIDGHIVVELDDANQHYTLCNGVRPVNDGKPHWIVVSRTRERTGGTVSINVDCALDAACASMTDLSMPLRAVQTGTSPCVDADGTSTLVGTVNDVCVWSM